MKSFAAVFCAAVIFISCSQHSKEKNRQTITTDSVSQHPDTSTVLVLPAPLQVATFFRQQHAPFTTDVLAKIPAHVPVSGTENQKALKLGIFIADAGYAALNGQEEIAKQYFFAIKDLVSSLGTGNEKLVGYAAQSVNNPDSLSHHLLSLCDSLQRQLNSTGQEKTAFFIISGGYLEGLTITLAQKQLYGSADFSRLLCQQHLWLDNFADGVTYLPNDTETQDLYNTFYTLQHYFAPMTFTTKKNIPASVFTNEQADSLFQKCVQLRDEIIAD